MKPVHITGVGIVSSLAHNTQSFWDSCLEGRTVTASVPDHWGAYYRSKSKYYSPLPVPDYSKYGLRRIELLSYDKAVLNAIVAADDAIQNAMLQRLSVDERGGRFQLMEVEPYRSGVFIGTGLGCITSSFENYVPHMLGAVGPPATWASMARYGTAEFDELLENYLEHPRVSPVASSKSMANSISAALSIRYGLRGANDTIIAACAAGSTAIAMASEAIARGDLDVALAGGSEYYGDRAGGVFMAFDRLGTLVGSEIEAPYSNRPFDRRRSGFLFSEGGACVLVLESEDHARGRGIQAFAKIIGTGRTSDARSLVAIERDDNSIQQMMDKAFASAGVIPGDIGYVNAHGTGTVQNDEIEAELITRTFGKDAVVNSTKSLLGHTIGACGAIEVAVTALSLYSQEVHPSINISEPIADLDFPAMRRKLRLDCAYTQNFGFGGHNVALVLLK